MTTESNETTPSKIDAESEKLESVSPTPESEQPTPELEQAAAESSPVQAKKPETGRFQRILRTALIALAAVIVVFLAGFLTDHFARYSPMKVVLTENLTQTQDELSQANQTISDLQSQIDNLTTQLTAANDRIAALEQDKENLQSDLDSANLHIELLTALGELKTAHIEFKNGNIAGAKVALSGTAARLENLKPLVETVDANLAANMLTRLNLILTGIEPDSATAQADLELLAKNLQSVETLLFSKK
jgi:septal ring factor EnvC (AmiA/AmiB activator)